MQPVEIARVLSHQSRVLFLDEPTASLTGAETDILFTQLCRLRHQGVSIVFVSHKLEEVPDVYDRVTALRDGGNACDSRLMAGLGRSGPVQLMIGRGEQIADWQSYDRTTSDPVLDLQGVSTDEGHRAIGLTRTRARFWGFADWLVQAAPN
jgi:ribose transport system ATP-binding protein